MSWVVRHLWKALPKRQRNFLLERMSVVDRQAVNKVLGGSSKLLDSFARHRCIFIHVPKCAGTSICGALFGNERPGHLPLNWYERVFPEFYRDAYKFAFVRDPLERALSAYRYLREDRGVRRDDPARELVNDYASFDDFINGWLCSENALRQMHFAPQHLFLTNALGRLEMDFIGRQESIHQDFAHICGQFGVDVELERRNSSGGNGISAAEQCSEDAKAIIRDVYRRDYKLLGYDLP